MKVISAVLTGVILMTSATFFTGASEDKFENTHVNTGDQRVDIVSIAKTQLGYMEGDNNDTKYGTWYGLPNQPWCAMFVSWCARQAGVPTDILRNCAMAAPYQGYFNITYYDGEEYTPKQGDLFFTKTLSHVGLVDYADGEYFYTVEGNTNDTGSSMGVGVFSLRRVTKDYYFGVPDYNYISKNHTCDKEVFVKYSEEHPHYAVYRCSICAKPAEVDTECGSVEGCIGCAAPQKPLVKVFSDPFLEDDAVTFQWAEDESAIYYDFLLYLMNERGEWDIYEEVTGITSGFTWRLSEGRYRCLLRAYNPQYKDDDNPNGVFTESDFCEFSVDKVKYVIEYDANMGSDAPETQTKNQGMGCRLRTEEPVREGYIFMGWSENRDARVPDYRFGEVYYKDASVILYAVWRDENSAGLLGDVNLDDVVNIKDATAIQKHIAGSSLISDVGLILADTDLNGSVNVKDATAIQKYLADIYTGLPIGEPF